MINKKDDQTLLSADEIHQLLADCIKDVFARRRIGKVSMFMECGMDDKFHNFNQSEFFVGDYCFEVFDNKLKVRRGCNLIGECDIPGELIGWLFQLLSFVIHQRHVKEMIRIQLHHVKF